MSRASSAARPIRVLLLGQQQLVQAGLRLLLKGADGFEVVDAVSADGRPRADIVLVDIDGRSNTTLTTLAPNLPKNARIVMLGSVLDAATLAMAFRQGVAGAVLKKEPPRVLLEALRHVADGEVWLDRAATTILVSGLSDAAAPLSRAAKRAHRAP